MTGPAGPPGIGEQHVKGKVAALSEKGDGKVGGGVLKGFKNWSP